VPDPRIAITGATGFVGRRLVARLLADGRAVRRITRRPPDTPAVDEDWCFVGAVDHSTDWRAPLTGVDVVVHLAARTHVVGERGGGKLVDYRPLNVDGTRRLAEGAARSGVRRLVFVSSIKVNGERTTQRPYTAKDPPRPVDAYGISKWEAEQALWETASATGLEVVVVRPPLVYGLGARGNFARLCNAVRRGLVLPLGAVKNRRSLVALDNLVDLLAVCASHPAAPGETFLVSDGEDLSTPELVRRMASAMRAEARLLSVPPTALRLAGRIAGRTAEVKRLLGSLQVDSTHTRWTLRWEPPLTVDQGLAAAVGDG
jgi:nucleoside-diphosphate-sugar epimerase